MRSVKNALRTPYISNSIVVRTRSREGKGVFTRRDIGKGTILVDIEARIVSKPTVYALQISRYRYLVANHIDNFINHSCEPNVAIRLHKDNPRRVTYLTIRRVKKGEELFWNYSTTEWIAGKKYSFPCRCGARNCSGTYKGMKYTPEKDQRRFFRISTPHIQKFLKKKLKIY